MPMQRETRLKSLAALLLAQSLIILAALPAPAADVKIIANSSIQDEEISSVRLKRIFLLEVNSLDDGTHVEPVLARRGQSHETFLKEVLDVNDNALQDYYRSLVFTGKSFMPKELSSDSEIIAYVAKTKGAIGYVGAETATPGVKTLTVINGGSGAQRKLITRIEPVYPDTLKRLQIGGTIRLQVTIAPKGNVETVTLMGGNPILAEAAISAVKQWVYSTSHSRTTTEVDIPFDAHP